MNKYQGSIIVYGVLMIVLGWIGYAVDANHHIQSGVGGTVLGLISIFFGALSKTNPRIGYIGASIVSIGAAGMFIPRSISDPKPGFIAIAVLSVALAVFLLGGHFLGKKTKAK